MKVGLSQVGGTIGLEMIVGEVKCDSRFQTVFFVGTILAVGQMFWEVWLHRAGLGCIPL